MVKPVGGDNSVKMDLIFVNLPPGKETLLELSRWHVANRFWEKKVSSKCSGFSGDLKNCQVAASPKLISGCQRAVLHVVIGAISKVLPQFQRFNVTCVICKSFNV